MSGNSRLRRLTLAAVCAAASAFPADWRALKPEGYFSDFARVADEASKAQIERYCDAVKRKTGAEISLVTVSTLDGDPIEDAANTLFRAWGVGEKGKNNGVLLLLAIRERRSRLEVGYEIEPHLLADFQAHRSREHGETRRLDSQLVFARRQTGEIIESFRAGDHAAQSACGGRLQLHPRLLNRPPLRIFDRSTQSREIALRPQRYTKKTKRQQYPLHTGKL